LIYFSKVSFSLPSPIISKTQSGCFFLTSLYISNKDKYPFSFDNLPTLTILLAVKGLFVFGLGGCGFTYLVAPFLDNLYNKIKPSIKYLIAIVLLSLFVIDNIYCHNKPNIGEGITTYKSDCNLEAKIL
jgi:hypothetical protein